MKENEVREEIVRNCLTLNLNYTAQKLVESALNSYHAHLLEQAGELPEFDVVKFDDWFQLHKLACSSLAAAQFGYRMFYDVYTQQAASESVLRERNKWLEDRFDHVFTSQLEKQIVELQKENEVFNLALTKIAYKDVKSTSCPDGITGCAVFHGVSGECGMIARTAISSLNNLDKKMDELRAEEKELSALREELISWKGKCVESRQMREFQEKELSVLRTSNDAWKLMAEAYIEELKELKNGK